MSRTPAPGFSTFLCSDLPPSAEVNQQFLSALFPSSQLSAQFSSGLIWREYWQSVCSLIGSRGAIHTDVSVVLVWIRFLEGPRQTKAIRFLLKWPLGLGNGSVVVERSSILPETLTLDETVGAFCQHFHEVSVQIFAFFYTEREQESISCCVLTL